MTQIGMRAKQIAGAGADGGVAERRKVGVIPLSAGYYTDVGRAATQEEAAQVGLDDGGGKLGGEIQGYVQVSYWIGHGFISNLG